jgi:hypothetical protein
MMDELLAKYPDDVLARLMAMDSALFLRDRQKLQGYLDAYGPDFDASDSIFLQNVPEFYTWYIDILERLENGPNVQDVYTREYPDLESKLSAMAAVQHGQPYLGSTFPLLLQYHGVPNFLDYQTMVKIARLYAVFSLLQGDIERALDLTMGSHATGTAMLATGSTMIERLIGIAICAISTAGIEMVYLDGMTTPAEIQRHWPRLVKAYETQLAAKENDLRFGELFMKRSALARPNYLEARTREGAALTKTALTLSVVAARYHYMTARDFPSSPADFAPLLIHGPAPDPFADPPAPLSYRRDSKRGFILYSVGPDQKDEHAFTEYDPTNGTISHGDISTNLPPSRQYPFPATALQLANTRDGILAMFPNGLPPDNFADVRLSSLAITDTRPALIWSWGPNVDQSAHFLPADPSSQAPTPSTSPYGPYNSPYGDPRGSAAPRPGPPPPGVAVSTINGQFLYYRNPEEPSYDPTNGIISAGNLYFSTAARP